MILICGAFLRSYFRAIEGRHATVEGFAVAARSEGSIQQIADALECLRLRSPHAFRVAKRWLHSIGLAERPWPRGRAHFCEGTVVLSHQSWEPASLLAAFLYRLAVEVMIAKRFHRPEVLLLWRPELLIGLRAELRLLRQLGAPDKFLAGQEEWVAIYKRKRMLQKRRTQTS